MTDLTPGDDNELVMTSFRLTRLQIRKLKIARSLTDKTQAQITREALQEFMDLILALYEEYESVVPLIHPETPGAFAVLPKGSSEWQIITNRSLRGVSNLLSAQ